MKRIQEYQIKFFERQSCWVLTWPSKLIVLILFSGLVILIWKSLYSFLAVHEPHMNYELLVIDGALPKYHLTSVLDEFEGNNYQTIVTVGGPITSLINPTGYKTVSELMAAALIRNGLSKHLVVPLSRGHVKTDRTYANAELLKDWLSMQTDSTSSINIISLGPHARRSRLLYRKALGSEYRIGVLSLSNSDYNGENWWRSSIGFRTVVGETIAFFYASLFFYPPNDI